MFNAMWLLGDPDNQLYWDDLNFPAQAINPPGQASDPTWDFTNIGWSFADAATEILQMVGQLRHSYKEGTDIHPHVHWRASQAGLPLWRMKYKWWNNGELEPDFTTIDIQQNVWTWATGNLGQISLFPAISGAGMKVSSNIVVELSRVGGDAADTYNGAAALMRDFDIHYQKDAPGSTQEYIKQQ